MAFLEDKSPPPYELTLEWRCKRYPGAMPNQGGIMDQPHALMRRMRICGDTYEIFRQRYQAHDAVKWTDDNPEAADYYAKVRLWLKHEDGYR